MKRSPQHRNFSIAECFELGGNAVDIQHQLTAFACDRAIADESLKLFSAELCDIFIGNVIAELEISLLRVDRTILAGRLPVPYKSDDTAVFMPCLCALDSRRLILILRDPREADNGIFSDSLANKLHLLISVGGDILTGNNIVAVGISEELHKLLSRLGGIFI